MRFSAFTFGMALALGTAAALASPSPAELDPALLRNGDIIFQTSRSGQSQAIQLATHSQYSHCGVIFFKRGKPYIFEASTQVKQTPLKRFVKKGEGGRCVIKRLGNADSLLTPENLVKLEKAGKAFEGLPYDTFFGWGDDRIYCSELVYKIYRNALGIEIGKTAILKDFDLSAPETRRVMALKYGTAIPMDETVIAPAAQFADTSLVEVFNNY